MDQIADKSLVAGDFAAEVLSRTARRARHRLRLRQCRHRFRADHRGCVAQQRRRKFPRFITAPHENRGDGHGQRLLPRRRQARGGDAARHRRHRQRHLPAHEHGARQRAGAAVRRPHAGHRDRPYRLAQRRDPLGPGIVRPGRHGARVRQMGLRAARGPAGRRAGRPRARHRHERAARPGLSLPAARSAGGRRRADAARQCAAARRRARCAVAAR